MGLALVAALANAGCTGGDQDGPAGPAGPVGQATETMTLASPDGDLRVGLWTTDDGGLRYQVDRGRGDGRTVLQPSRLQVTFDEATFVDGLTIDPDTSLTGRTRTFDLDLPRGKQRSISVDGREATVVVENEAGDRLAVDLIAFDDGVAHRFRPLTDRPLTLAADSSSFAFADDGEMFVQLYDKAGVTTPASEAYYSTGRAVDQIYPAFTGWSFPALFNTGDHWTLVTETAVGRHHVGSRLLNDRDSAEHVLTPPPDNQVEGPAVTGPPSGGEGAGGGAPLPWKVIITSTDLGQVVASNLAEVLADPSPVQDWSWVRPGRVSWSWWSDSASPTRPDALRPFIDFAAEMGWEYSLIDANWTSIDPDELVELIEYGNERGVGLFLWYNSGGPHNVVTEAPRDRMTEAATRRAELARIRELGIVGVKVDFFHGDKASMNALALDILADTAEAELLVNFHGITSPKGWHATWPHLLTTEAVRGAEQYKFDSRFPELAAGHNTVLAFTRNVVGPMDYTPVTVSDATFRRVTTAGHELALGVVFESGLQHLADTPAAYRGLGQDGLDYLRRLPVVWDQIELLDGRPGSHVVIARRHGERWWIGGLNGTDEAMTVELDLGPLDGLGPLRLAVDGEQRDDLEFIGVDDDRLTVEMAPAGGFVAWPADTP